MKTAGAVSEPDLTFFLPLSLRSGVGSELIVDSLATHQMQKHNLIISLQSECFFFNFLGYFPE